MGFLKKLGAFGGTLVGGAIGGIIFVVGQVGGSEFIEEIVECVFKSTVAAGKILGETASGAFDVVDGIIASDKSKIDEKNVAIGTFAIGLIDILDGGLIDSYNMDIGSDVEVHDVKSHEVSEYYRYGGTHVGAILWMVMLILIWTKNMGADI